MTQIVKDINYISMTSIRLPPLYITFPHLLYTNAKTILHNKHVFENPLGEAYNFVAKDIPTETCLHVFKLFNVGSQICGLDIEIFLKNNMLIELCARNHVALSMLMEY